MVLTVGLFFIVMLAAIWMPPGLKFNRDKGNRVYIAPTGARNYGAQHVHEHK